MSDVVPVVWRGPLLLVVALGALAFGGLALAGWIRRGLGADQIAETHGDRSEAYNQDASRGGARQEARTRGQDSPATNIRGRG